MSLLVEVVEETLLHLVVVSGSVRAEQRPHLRSPYEPSIPQLDALQLPDSGPPADRARRESHV